MLLDVGGSGSSKCCGRPIFIFFIKENWICATSRRPDIMLSHYYIIDFPIDSGIRHRSRPLMIPFNCLRTKSNNRTPGQFECDVSRFCFCLISFRYTMRLLFNSLLESSVCGGRGVCLKILNVDEQGGWASYKLQNFHGRHKCIVPNTNGHKEKDANVERVGKSIGRLRFYCRRWYYHYHHYYHYFFGTFHTNWQSQSPRSVL